MSDDEKIDQGVLEAFVAGEANGLAELVGDENTTAAAIVHSMAEEILELRQKSAEDDEMLRSKVKEMARLTEEAQESRRVAEWENRARLETQQRLDNALQYKEKPAQAELHSLLKLILQAGQSSGVQVGGRFGPAFVGLKFSVYQIREIAARVGLDPKKPSERYLPYDILLEKYAATSAALEAALQDLKDPQNKNSKDIFNMRRMLGCGPDDDVLLTLERLMDEITSGVIQVEVVKVPKEGLAHRVGLGVDFPEPDKVH